VFVLGVEAIGATALSALYLHESLSLSRIAAVLLVIAGVAWLRRT
jgi:multidrug transporter EmrE-like cation transporter